MLSNSHKWSEVSGAEKGCSLRRSCKSRSQLWQALKVGLRYLDSSILQAMGHQRKFRKERVTQCALCSPAACERTGSRPGPGSGRRPHLFSLSARPSSRAAGTGIGRVPRQVVQLHIGTSASHCALGPDVGCCVSSRKEVFFLRSGQSGH